MKKVVLVLLIFLISGCEQGIQNDKDVELNYDKEYYTVYTPYKNGVSNNYVVGNSINNYNIEEIESALMYESMKYFKTNNSYYQEGQYLTEKALKTLLDNEHLNSSEKITIDNITITPTYITSIYEQNFLASNGTLKGMSLGLVINPYQKYINSYGSYQYKKVDDNILIQIANTKTEELVKYMRKNYDLEDIRILVAVYFQSHPNAITPGKYEYVGITTNSNISLEKTNYAYQLLDSSYVSTNDIGNYDAFVNLKKELNNEISNLYIIGYGSYNNKLLSGIDITINGTSLNKNKILYISQLLSKKLVSDFSNTSIKVYLKTDNQIKGIITKRHNDISCDVHILD